MYKVFDVIWRYIHREKNLQVRSQSTTNQMPLTAATSNTKDVDVSEKPDPDTTSQLASDKASNDM